MIVGSSEGQLNCGKVEESHGEINAGIRHDSNKMLEWVKYGSCSRKSRKQCSWVVLEKQNKRPTEKC